MKDSRLTLLIKKITRKKLIMPVLFLIFILFILFNNSLYHIISPRFIPDPSAITESYNDGYVYTKCHFTDLYYTGVNHVRSGKADAAYYYCIFDGKCYYVLLSLNNPLVADSTGTPNAYINDITFRAKLSRNTAPLNEVITRLSKSLGWTSSALSGMSSKILINQYEMSYCYIYILFIFIILSILTAIIHLIIVAVALINPRMSRTVLHLKKYGDVNELFPLAEEEYDTTRSQAEGLLLTGHFYIGYDKHNIHIVPLENIVWAYKFGTMHNRLFHARISYSICVVTDKKKQYVVHGKPKESAAIILNALQTRHPEILIGYNEGHASK